MDDVTEAEPIPSKTIAQLVEDVELKKEAWENAKRGVATAQEVYKYADVQLDRATNALGAAMSESGLIGGNYRLVTTEYIQALKDGEEE